MWKRLTVLVIVFAGLARAAPPTGPPWLVLHGTVTRVKDGNNLTVVDDEGIASQVRLVGIDAPELTQPGGRDAWLRLRELVADRTVRVVHRYADHRGRTLGKVHAGDTYVNEVLLREGRAWRRDPDGDTPELAGLQAEARKERRGIWKNGTEVVPPWFWRRGTFFYREGMEDEKPQSFPRSRSSNKPRTIGYP